MLLLPSRVVLAVLAAFVRLVLAVPSLAGLWLSMAACKHAASGWALVVRSAACCLLSCVPSSCKSLVAIELA